MLEVGAILGKSLDEVANLSVAELELWIAWRNERGETGSNLQPPGRR